MKPTVSSSSRAARPPRARPRRSVFAQAILILLGVTLLWSAQPAQAQSIRGLFGTSRTSLSSILGWFMQPWSWWRQPTTNVPLQTNPPAPTPTPTPQPTTPSQQPTQAATRVDLRVLLIAVGNASADPSRAVMEALLKQMGTPYDVFDASARNLTAADLETSGRGKYNGIILTQSETYLPGGGAGFDAAEFGILQAYERKFNVRESVMSGFPTSNAAAGLDYGMGAVSSGNDVVAQWTGAAGGNEIFEYVNTSFPLPTSGFTYLAVPRNDPAGPTVEPLLVDSSAPSQAIVAKLSYPDGRQVLLSAINNATWFLHSHVLAYEFVNFATSGLFIGGRRAYLEIHNDDMFLPDEIWNEATNSNFPEDDFNFRLSGDEVSQVVAAQNAFHSRHPLASAVITDIAFNAVGASASDPLTQALQQLGPNFGFINHTFEAKQMDRLCEVEGSGNCPRTDYATAFAEIDNNARAWIQYGFPDSDVSRKAVLTDSHSGLSDRLGTENTDDDIPFPNGFNAALGRAAADLGVRMLASDHSRQNQDTIQRVPNFDLALMPRYPTSLFYNTATPAQLVSEYNYIFHYRYVEQGQDPCAIPAAICTPRSYEQILAAEADAVVRHILGYTPYPHYFHQPNLHTYDSAGHILQFDWQDAVLSSYERLVNLPLENPRFDELADIAWDVIRAREAGTTGYLEVESGRVSISAARAANVMITGIAGGDTYGGQSQRTVAVSTSAQTFNRDQALNR